MLIEVFIGSMVGFFINDCVNHRKITLKSLSRDALVLIGFMGVFHFIGQ